MQSPCAPLLAYLPNFFDMHKEVSEESWQNYEFTAKEERDPHSVHSHIQLSLSRDSEVGKVETDV